MSNKNPDHKPLPPVLHTLKDLSFASASVFDVDGKPLPMFRMMLTVDRQDANGQTQNILWPDLFLEPHTADMMCHAIRSALAKYHPDFVQSLELSDRGDKPTQ